MNKEQQIEELYGVIDLWATNAVRINKYDGASVYNPYNAKSLAEAIYNAGYRKTYVSKTEKLLPCKCGCNMRELWHNQDGGVFYICKRCGYRSKEAKNEISLRKIWNEEMSMKMSTSINSVAEKYGVEVEE